MEQKFLVQLLPNTAQLITLPRNFPWCVPKLFTNKVILTFSLKEFCHHWNKKLVDENNWFMDKTFNGSSSLVCLCKCYFWKLGHCLLYFHPQQPWQTLPTWKPPTCSTSAIISPVQCISLMLGYYTMLFSSFNTAMSLN